MALVSPDWPWDRNFFFSCKNLPVLYHTALKTEALNSGWTLVSFYIVSKINSEKLKASYYLLIALESNKHMHDIHLLSVVIFRYLISSVNCMFYD